MRAALTAFGVVLGVGMVFGVLLLVGTIRHTFDDLISSAWGKTDLIVGGTANGVLPESSAAKVRAVPGVRDAAPWAGGMFTRLDGRGRAVEGRVDRPDEQQDAEHHGDAEHDPEGRERGAHRPCP